MIGAQAHPRPRSRALRTGAAALTIIGALSLTGCASLFNLFFTPNEAPIAEVEGNNYAAQRPAWQACGEMQCARVQAPIDWADPGGDRIELALVKQPATGGSSMGTIFVNPGGPGASGADFIASSIDYAIDERLQENYDIVGWDPRGVGQSSAVSCLDDAGLDELLYGSSLTDGIEPGSQEWVDAAIIENAEFGAACLEATGPLLEHVDTLSTVQDLEMLREIVGDEKLNYLGFSYGSYIGARYADEYADRVGRVVLDGAIDPTATLADVVREQTRGFELSLRAYVTDCLNRQDCPLDGSVDTAMSQWRALLDSVDADPLTGEDGRMVNAGTLLTAVITPLYSIEMWPYLDQLFVASSQGDASVALSLADYYNDRLDGVYTTNLLTAFTAINCLDYPRPEPLDLEQMRANAAELERIAPTIGAFQGFGEVGCLGWPGEAVQERLPVSAEGAEPILVIGTTGDPATPFRWAESLSEQLESGVLIAFEGEGHLAYTSSECVATLVDDYFVTGAVPESGIRCR